MLFRSNIDMITDLVIADINKRIADKDIRLAVTDAAKGYIAECAYDPVYGARPLKRYIQKNVETLLAKKILSGDIGQGDEVTLDIKDGVLKIM